VGTSTGQKQEQRREPYEKPTAIKLTSGEGKLKVVEQASRGTRERKTCWRWFLVRVRGGPD